MADVSPSIAARLSEMAAEIIALRARLAEVEAERDEWVTAAKVYANQRDEHAAALARVREEYEAWTTEGLGHIDGIENTNWPDAWAAVGAALRGPQDDYAEKTRDLLAANQRADDAYPEVTRDEVQRRTGMSEEQMDGLLRHFGVSPETVRPIEEMERDLRAGGPQDRCEGRLHTPECGCFGPQDEEAAEHCPHCPPGCRWEHARPNACIECAEYDQQRSGAARPEGSET